jgi:hypothetical protein
MADPLLAMIGAITLFILGIAAVIALVVETTQLFLALFKTILKS